MSPVLVERNGAVAIVTLNRPGALNSMSQELMRALDRAVDDIAADEAVRAVVITGAGKAFAAGGDLLEFRALREAGPQNLIDVLAFNQGVLEKIERLAIPVIAAVNGVAVAGGLELILCCDVVIAATGAKLGDGHAAYAIIPAGGATARLIHKVPVNVAMHLFYSGELFPAQKFADWGLVNEVTPEAELLSRATTLAKGYTKHSRAVLAAMKRLAQASAGALAEQARSELREFETYVNHPDLAAGLARFAARRPSSPAKDAPA
jgi:enoyl-CoA hydratase/carnithine racemase